jgi:HSP20 family protein
VRDRARLPTGDGDDCVTLGGGGDAACLDLPGIDPDAIELTVEQELLTIRAERRFEPQEDDELLVIERPQGVFSRQLLLSESFDNDELEAEYVNGVLRLTISVAEQAKPRRIEVGRGGNQPTTIEGTAKKSSQSNS